MNLFHSFLPLTQTAFPSHPHNTFSLGYDFTIYTWLPDCPREGNGTPFQYSCLENPMDRGAWWAVVHGVAKSRAQLSDFSFTLMHWRRKWQPTPVFLPGESQGRQSLVGCHLWGSTDRTWLKQLSSSSSSQTAHVTPCTASSSPTSFICTEDRCHCSFLITLLTSQSVTYSH